MRSMHAMSAVAVVLLSARLFAQEQPPAAPPAKPALPPLARAR